MSRSHGFRKCHSNSRNDCSFISFLSTKVVFSSVSSSDSSAAIVWSRLHDDQYSPRNCNIHELILYPWDLLSFDITFVSNTMSVVLCGKDKFTIYLYVSSWKYICFNSQIFTDHTWNPNHDHQNVENYRINWHTDKDNFIISSISHQKNVFVSSRYDIRWTTRECDNFKFSEVLHPFFKITFSFFFFFKWTSDDNIRNDKISYVFRHIWSRNPNLRYFWSWYSVTKWSLTKCDPSLNRNS